MSDDAATETAGLALALAGIANVFGAIVDAVRGFDYRVRREKATDVRQKPSHFLDEHGSSAVEDFQNRVVVADDGAFLGVVCSSIACALDRHRDKSPRRRVRSRIVRLWNCLYVMSCNPPRAGVFRGADAYCMCGGARDSYGLQQPAPLLSRAVAKVLRPEFFADLKASAERVRITRDGFGTVELIAPFLVSVWSCSSVV